MNSAGSDVIFKDLTPALCVYKFSNELLKIKAEGVQLLIVESITLHQKTHPEISPSDDVFATP